MIHERIFAAFILFTLIRLWLAAGFSSPHAIFYAASLLLVISGAAFTRKSGSPAAWRARLLIYPVLMNALFVNMRWVSPLINGGKKDAILWKLDEMILGGNLSVMLQGAVTPALTELMSFCYMFFMVYLFLSMLMWLLQDVKTARIFYAGLFGLYGIGYFGYTLVPAIGPYIAYADQFSTPLKGWLMTDFLTYAYPSGTNYTDIFPSLHCAVSVYLLFFDMRWNRRRFMFCALPCVGIWFSTIYLRYHYFVDVAAGFALGAAGLWIAYVAAAREELREIR
jgi:membrane-associated phospholipid phosphatase